MTVFRGIPKDQLNHFSPIGVFDSGVGGLTIVQEIVNQLPHERVVYFGDTARSPYGEKTPEQILRYSIENALFLARKASKILVVACGTASVHSSEYLRQQFDLPVIDVIESGVEEAVLQTKNERIGVLATRSSIASGMYAREIMKCIPKASVQSVACPLLVPLIEEHFVNHPATKLILNEYLKPFKNSQVDTLLLGCTHYPLLSHLIREEMPNVQIISPAATCVKKIHALLHKNQLTAKPIETPQHQFFISGDSLKFSKFAEMFFNLRSYIVEDDW